MTETIFEIVRRSVSLREAAELYGIEIGRNGMACCPFHDDKNPSLKLNEDYFYCFGCGATGDVIDFTARLYDLTRREAAEKLALLMGDDDLRRRFSAHAWDNLEPFRSETIARQWEDLLSGLTAGKEGQA